MSPYPERRPTAAKILEMKMCAKVIKERSPHQPMNFLVSIFNQLKSHLFSTSAPTKIISSPPPDHGAFIPAQNPRQTPIVPGLLLLLSCLPLD